MTLFDNCPSSENLIFSYFLGNTSFYKLENNSSPSKIIQKYLMFGRQFGFSGSFIMEKNTSSYL